MRGNGEQRGTSNAGQTTVSLARVDGDVLGAHRDIAGRACHVADRFARHQVAAADLHILAGADRQIPRRAADHAAVLALRDDAFIGSLGLLLGADAER